MTITLALEGKAHVWKHVVSVPSELDSDAQVVQASWDEPERFAEVYDRYFREIHRYIARRLGPDVADDVAAEVFLAAFAKRHRFDPDRGRVKPWLYGFAGHVIAQHRRVETRRYRLLARMGTEGEAAEGIEDLVTDRVAAQAATLAPALRRLSSGDRDVLLLVALGGLGYDEVAEALDIPTGTVASRLNRARRKLRAALSYHGGEGDQG